MLSYMHVYPFYILVCTLVPISLEEVHVFFLLIGFSEQIWSCLGHDRCWTFSMWCAVGHVDATFCTLLFTNIKVCVWSKHSNTLETISLFPLSVHLLRRACISKITVHIHAFSCLGNVLCNFVSSVLLFQKNACTGECVRKPAPRPPAPQGMQAYIHTYIHACISFYSDVNNCISA